MTFKAYQHPSTEKFYWGAATASYQVEGGNENTDWAKAATEGKVPEAGMLAEHYYRYKEDFDIAVELGHNAHRFSIEWARIEPTEGEFNLKEIEHYRNVLKALRERNLEPFITLWHFTLPEWFSETGGFERADAPEVFARYCAYVVDNLGDLCTHFSTMNEPNVYATHGYLYGAWPPFKRVKVLWKKVGKEDGTSEKTGAIARFSNLFRYIKVEKKLVTSHRLAFKIIKRKHPNIKISVVKHVRVFLSANKNPVNRLLASIMQYFQTYRFMNALRGEYDEIGLNFYRVTEFGGVRNFLTTDMDWKVFPSAIYYALKILSKYEKPLFVAEGGVADEDDDIRAQYISQEVTGMKKAMSEGVNVIGHMYWSMMDNYEWALGTGKRFGLVEINYQTLERKIRSSAYVYKEIIKNNDIVE